MTNDLPAPRDPLGAATALFPFVGAIFGISSKCRGLESVIQASDCGIRYLRRDRLPLQAEWGKQGQDGFSGAEYKALLEDKGVDCYNTVLRNLLLVMRKYKGRTDSEQEFIVGQSCRVSDDVNRGFSV